MPRTSSKPPARKAPWQLPAAAEEQARTCIRAADMRARGAGWGEIAAELGLASPADAKKTVERGYGLAPGEDYRMGRRKSFDELNLIRRGLWDIISDPGPATTVSGKVITVTDPETGVESTLQDRQVMIAAYNGLRAVNEQERKLGGYDAPRQSVAITASASLEEIQAQIARVRAEIEAEAGGGPPALPPGQG